MIGYLILGYIFKIVSTIFCSIPMRIIQLQLDIGRLSFSDVRYCRRLLDRSFPGFYCHKLIALVFICQKIIKILLFESFFDFYFFATREIIQLILYLYALFIILLLLLLRLLLLLLLLLLFLWLFVVKPL
jgi:hypothetical protein